MTYFIQIPKHVSFISHDGFHCLQAEYVKLLQPYCLNKNYCGVKLPFKFTKLYLRQE